jgi:hypothetical protein
MSLAPIGIAVLVAYAVGSSAETFFYLGAIFSVIFMFVALMVYRPSAGWSSKT